MGTRSRWALLLVALCLSGIASAGPDPKAKTEIQAKSKEAMESYDLMDYDAAKKALGQALEKAKAAKLDNDPIVAKVYLFLGIATFAAGDTDGATKAFASAIAIDPKIQIDAAYKQPELVKLLESARKGGGTPITNGGGEPSGGDDCGSVKGLKHTIVDAGKTNSAQPLEALVGADLTPAKVSIFYRVEGSTDFVEAKMSKNGGCKYTGAIPATAMKGNLLHYYVAAYDGANKIIDKSGSQGSPNIMELTVGKGGGTDVEDPIKGGGSKGGTPSGGNVSGGVIVGGKSPKVFIAVAGGTGFGYVTGITEANNEVQNCCLGNSLVVITPELGYYASRQLSIGIAGRIGLPIGANVDPTDPPAKHSTIAPAAVVRIRYALSSSGEGLRVMGQVGGGVMRNTIKLEMQPGGGDTDIVAQGPLLIGAGIGFKKNLSANLAFIADLSALAGIAVVDKLGTARLNTGVGGDVTLGLAVGF